MTKYINVLKERFDSADYPVFTLSDIRVLLKGRGISPRYLKLLINHLMKTEKMRRITKGVYTFHDDSTVIGFAFRPFYYGMEDALSYRNLWTQTTNSVIMTTNRVREGLRTFGNNNYIVKRVKPELFFGFSFIRRYDLWIPVSDPEKTLIDLVHYKHGVRSDALAELIRIVDKKKLDEYLAFYNNGTREMVHSCLDKGRLAEELKSTEERNTMRKLHFNVT